MKIAIISGLSGQDGSYLADLLASKQYKIFGIVRKSSVIKLEILSPFLLTYPHLVLKDVELSNTQFVFDLIKEIKDTHDLTTLEIYNLLLYTDRINNK